MIRFIAAIDSQRGIADDHGIPWQGKVPGDVAYYREKANSGSVFMGYGVYVELTRPYAGGINYVATSKEGPLRPGFEIVHDARAFLRGASEDIWNLGGAVLFASTFDLADELYLTKLQADFNCTKFFPAYEEAFDLVSESEPIIENGITYSFCVYARKQM